VAEAAASAAPSEDRLLGGRVRLRQPARGYRAAIDPVLLAAAVPAGAGEHVLDLGTGAGAAALCLAARVPECRITGVEIEPVVAALARANARLNGVADRVRVIEAEIGALDTAALGPADHVMANPPYLPPARAAPAKRDDRATVETGAGLAGWVAAALALVREKGSVTFVHRADRLDELLVQLHRAAGEIVVFPLWPRPAAAAKRVIVRARRGVATPLRLAPGLVLHRPDGSYTGAAQAVLRGARALDMDPVEKAID
jgi:tRNA1(Val) A37 N6-methylase TrmN6